MRFIVILIFIILFDLYAFQAFTSVGQNWSKSVKILVFSLYWLIPFLAIGMMIATSTGSTANWNKHFFMILRSVLMIIYLSKLLIVSVLVIDDIRRIVMGAYESMGGVQDFDRGRSRFLSQMAIFLGALPFITLTYGIIRNRHRYKIFNENVIIENLPKALEGLRIIQISDIHSGSFTEKEPIRAAIDMINDQKADLVFFTGDLVNSLASEMKDYVDVFDKIQSRYGVFSILGNHDYGDYARWPNQEAKKQNLQDLINTHKDMGWDIMLNENRIININGENVAIIGVENYSAKPHFQKYGDLQKACLGIENTALKLLLSHDPTHWEDEVLKKFKDIAITFSGHTHGFQFGVEIPGWVKWSPVKYIYKQWAGLYQEGKQYLYVNRGFGFLGYPGRVGILPEITVMELKSKQ